MNEEMKAFVKRVDIKLALCSSATRGWELIDSLVELEIEYGYVPATFWTLFNEWWSACDSTWELQSDLRELLTSKGCGVEYSDNDSKAFFESLPSELTVYRGCSRERVLGISWTTDKAVAESFRKGHRRIPVPDPVIANATIKPAEIHAVFVAREESEVLWLPTIDRIETE